MRLKINSELIESIATKISACKYGQSFSHDVLAKLFNENKKNARYYYCIKKVNELLLKYNKRLKSINSYGYKLMMPSEFPELAYKYIEKALHHIRFSRDIIQNSPQSRMNKTLKTQSNTILSETREIDKKIVNSILDIKYGKKNPFIIATSDTKKIKA